jgi:hypothetical protein
MEIASLFLTIGSGYLIYRITNFSIGRDEQFYNRRSRFHKRASYYSDYTDVTPFLDTLKIPPHDPKIKTDVYLRHIPAARKWEMDMGMGAYFIIDQRQYDELMRYRNNFNVIHETHQDKTKFHGTPTTKNQPDYFKVPGPDKQTRKKIPDNKHQHKTDMSHKGREMENMIKKIPATTMPASERANLMAIQV